MTDQQALRNIAANMRRLREQKTLSMRALAERIGVYAPAIKRIEDEENMPGVGLLTRIAEGLDVTLNDLVAPATERARREKLAHAS